MRHLLLLLCVPLLGSCFLAREMNNVPLPATKVASIVPGQTTAAQVVELLGAPVEVVQLAHRSAYRYEFDQLKRSGLFLIVVGFYNTDKRSDRVWVFLSEDDVVTHVGTTFEADGVEWAMPWYEVHD